MNFGIANGQPSAWVNDIGWRYMFASEAIPAFLFFILIFFIPETPRYLASKNKEVQAFNVLSRVNGSKERAQAVLAEIKESLSKKTALRQTIFLWKNRNYCWDFTISLSTIRRY